MVPSKVPLHVLWHTTRSLSATSLNVVQVESGTAPMTPFNGPTKIVESDLGIPIRLTVRHVWMHQTLEVDDSRVPLIVERLDNCLVFFEPHRSHPSSRPARTCSGNWQDAKRFAPKKHPLEPRRGTNPPSAFCSCTAHRASAEAARPDGAHNHIPLPRSWRSWTLSAT
jgi:hypothetical protein